MYVCPECKGYEYVEGVECWFCDGSGEWPPNYEYIEEKKKNPDKYDKPKP